MALMELKQWKRLGFGMALILGLEAGIELDQELEWKSFSIAFAAVSQQHSPVRDDTALYQRLSEIQAVKQGPLSFDQDIDQLSSKETQYRERLPSLLKHPRLLGPIQRISRQRYHK